MKKKTIIVYILILCNLSLLVFSMVKINETDLLHKYLISARTKIERLNSRVNLHETNLYKSLQIEGVELCDGIECSTEDGKIVMLHEYIKNSDSIIYLYYSETFCQSCVASLVTYLTSLPEKQRAMIVVLMEKVCMKEFHTINIQNDLELNCLYCDELKIFENISTPCFIKFNGNKISQFFLYSKEFERFNKEVLNLLLSVN